jgi:hypothetical protein
VSHDFRGRPLWLQIVQPFQLLNPEKAWSCSAALVQDIEAHPIVAAQGDLNEGLSQETCPTLTCKCRHRSLSKCLDNFKEDKKISSLAFP